MTRFKVDPRAWAEQEFGHALVDDRRNTARGIQMLERLVARPAGTVTAVFDNDAELQGAYDWLENSRVQPTAVQEALGRAAATRCQGLPYVLVPEDGSSLRVTDKGKDKGTGSIGTRKSGARGLKVISALAVRPDGTVLGVLGQHGWARPARAPTVPAAQRPLAEKETRHWLEVREQARDRLQRFAPGCRPWFQIDREGDNAAVLLDVLDHGDETWTTVRATWNRRLAAAAADGTQQRLHDAVKTPQWAGTMVLDVPASKTRTARHATLTVRAAEVALQVTLRLSDRPTTAVPLWVVHVLETSAVPGGEAPIEWWLLTNGPVASFEDVLRVVQNYASRWRVEDFHKAIKSGAGHVEAMQLRSVGALVKWAIFHSGVAARTVGLAWLARTEPDLPATDVFSAAELNAVDALQARSRFGAARTLPVRTVVFLIAKLGGYTGRRPERDAPGFVTIMRGLRRVLDVARAFRNRSRHQRTNSAANSTPEETNG